MCYYVFKSHIKLALPELRGCFATLPFPAYPCRLIPSHIYDDERKEHKHLRKVKWTNNGEFEFTENVVQKTSTDVTPYNDYVQKLNAQFGDDMPEGVEEKEIGYPAYTEQDFLNEVYLDEDKYNTLHIF